MHFLAVGGLNSWEAIMFLKRVSLVYFLMSLVGALPSLAETGHRDCRPLSSTILRDFPIDFNLNLPISEIKIQNTSDQEAESRKDITTTMGNPYNYTLSTVLPAEGLARVTKEMNFRVIDVDFGTGEITIESEAPDEKIFKMTNRNFTSRRMKYWALVIKPNMAVFEHEGKNWQIRPLNGRLNYQICEAVELQEIDYEFQEEDTLPTTVDA